MAVRRKRLRMRSDRDTVPPYVTHGLIYSGSYGFLSQSNRSHKAEKDVFFCHSVHYRSTTSSVRKQTLR